MILYSIVMKIPPIGILGSILLENTSELRDEFEFFFRLANKKSLPAA